MLAPSAPLGCLFLLTSFLSPSDVPCCVLSGSTGSWSLSISYPRLVLLPPLVYQVDGEFLSPPCPGLSAPVTPLPLRFTPEVLSPWGNSFT